MSSFSIADAAEQAKRLLSLKAVKGIYLFGSVARFQPGSDLDFILVVDDELAQWFLTKCAEDLDSMYRSAELRKEIACQVLDLPDWTFPYYMDVFLFPASWKGMLERLQEELPHQDPEFMENIASDARYFDPIKGVFTLSLRQQLDPYAIAETD